MGVFGKGYTSSCKLRGLLYNHIFLLGNEFFVITLGVIDGLGREHKGTFSHKEFL
jgi:hypothetical protein